jgi:carboxylesterase type B
MSVYMVMLPVRSLAMLNVVDQRAVLDWIQNHIHLVGGDKSEVTMIGLFLE